MISRQSRSLEIGRVLLLVFIFSIIILEFPGARDLISPPYSGINTRNLVVQDISEIENFEHAHSEIDRIF